MKTKHKKWLYVSLIILLATPVILLHSAFNGNPLSKYMAKRHLEHYLTETYPEQTLHIEDTFYNFKDSGYHFEVLKVPNGVEENSENFEFVVHGFLKMTVGQDGIYNDNLDESLMEKLGNEASSELETALKMEGVDIIDITVQMEILKGTYDDVTWEPDLKTEEPIVVHITIDAEDKTNDDILKIAKHYQKQLNDDQYDYKFVSINGNVKITDFEFGHVKYDLSFQPSDDLTIKDVGVEKQEK